MKVITVIIDNRPGVVADILSTVAENGINIESFNTDGVDKIGVVILTVDKYDKALQVLCDAGYQAISEDALVLRLQDEPGALAKISLRFKYENINIRSLRILKRESDHALVTIVTDDNNRAQDLVKDVLVNI